MQYVSAVTAVLYGSVHECHSRHRSSTTDQSGNLASSVAVRTSIGSSSCPWHLRAAPGQRVNLTLLSFIPPTVTASSPSDLGGASSGVADQSGSSAAGASRPEICYDVALIRDGDKRRSVTACAGQARRRNMFISETNVVDLEFAVRSMVSPGSAAAAGLDQQGTAASLTPQFIVQFQCKSFRLVLQLLFVSSFY